MNPLSLYFVLFIISLHSSLYTMLLKVPREGHFYVFLKRYNSRKDSSYELFSAPLHENILAYCKNNSALSLINIHTNITRPYDSIPDIMKDELIKAIQLFDAQTPVILHTKKIYFLREEFNIINMRKNIYSYPRTYTLKPIKTLDPSLDDDDELNTIDSSTSHFIALSKKRNIFIWKKNNTTLVDTTEKKIFCLQEFFSSGIYKAENMLCLGLNNGEIFTLNLDTFEEKIINLFPNTTIKINWIQPSQDELLFAGVCKEPNNLYCCKRNPHGHVSTEACDDCQLKTTKPVGDQVISLSKATLQQALNDFKKTLKNTFMRGCKHSQEKIKEKEITEKNMPEICNCHNKKLFFSSLNAHNLLYTKPPSIQKIDLDDSIDYCITELHITVNKNLVIRYFNNHNQSEYSDIIIYNAKNNERRISSFCSELSNSFKIIISTDEPLRVLTQQGKICIDRINEDSIGIFLKRAIANQSYKNHFLMLTISLFLTALLKTISPVQSYVYDLLALTMCLFTMEFIAIYRCSH